MKLFTILVLTVLSGCASVPRATKDGRVLDVWSQISTKSYIRVRGIGVVMTGTRSQTARRGQSRSAALVSARYELLSVIRGVKLEGGVTISQAMEKSSLIKEIANDLVKGGEEVLTEFLPDDSCVVTLELKRSTVEHLIERDSPRERALAAEVDKLNKLLAAAVRSPILDMDPYMIDAVQGKAAIVQDAQDRADDLQKQIDAGYQPTVGEIMSILNRIAAAQKVDVEEDAKWARYWHEHK